MSKGISGSCLCGKVKCTVQGPFQRFYQCYCSRCQKRTGSAFASLMFTTPDKIEWHSGKELTKRYDLPDAERFSTCFCSECGSPVPYISRSKSFLIVPAGFSEGDPEVKPSANIFTRFEVKQVKNSAITRLKVNNKSLLGYCGKGNQVEFDLGTEALIYIYSL